MGTIILAVGLVLAVIFVVPFVLYGLAASLFGLKTPATISPLRFLLGTLIGKIGTALAFVLIFSSARSSLSGQWPFYAAMWWIMFVAGEAEQAVGRESYSWKEALVGIVSEGVYLPLSAYLTQWLLQQ